MIAAVPMAKEYLLRTKLSGVKDQFDYVFIDCPPSRNNLTVNALTASDYAILPCESTMYGIDSMIAMNDFVMDIGAFINPKLKVAGILFTKKENTSAQNAFCEQIKQMLNNHHFFKTEIRKTTVVEKSLVFYQPLIVCFKNENVTKDYLDVADELETIINEGE
jgi:chromosome partitioning protein